MKLVIAYLHNDRLVCKCDFDCKSPTRCQCEKRIISHQTYQHSSRQCNVNPLKHNDIKSLVKYHMSNFKITKMEYVFDITYDSYRIDPIIYVLNGIKKLKIDGRYMIKKWYYEFPEYLRYLDISGCKLSRIGMPKLPPKLKEFNCDNCELHGLRVLPDSLETLLCRNNNIVSLYIPPNLKYLNCRNSKITHIYDVPDTLKHLDCSHNNLTKLPKLSDSIKTLLCHKNSKLKDIPIFPDNLQILDIHGCNMKHVPNIPKNILFLCTNKPIVSVDDIDLEEKLCPSNQYRYSPYKTLLDKFGNTFDICDVEPIIKQWYAVKIISEWFL